jgi:hypothetical protein
LSRLRLSGAPLWHPVDMQRPALVLPAPWGADCASAELAIVTPPIIETSKSLIGLHAGTHFDHAACSYSVAQAHHAFYLGAMLAAEEGAFLFESVTNNMNAAIPAGRGQRMDCTLEAVECVGCTIHGHFERLVVVVSAGFASSHDGSHQLWGGVFTLQPAPGRAGSGERSQ